MSIADVIPAGVSATAEQQSVLLEIAYLTTAADGRLRDEELVAFKEVVSRLRGRKASDADVDALLAKYAGPVDHEDIVARVKAIAPTLPNELRPLAFKLSVALGVADLDTHADEIELHSVLAEALGIDDAKVDDLTAEVYEALGADDE